MSCFIKRKRSDTHKLRYEEYRRERSCGRLFIEDRTCTIRVSPPVPSLLVCYTNVHFLDDSWTYNSEDDFRVNDFFIVRFRTVTPSFIINIVNKLKEVQN